MGLIEERGPTNFVITVREEDISKVEGKTLHIRNHRTRVDVFLLKSKTDQRMELPSAPAENFRSIDIKFYSDVPQPFAPAPKTEHVMKLVLRNFSDFPKRVRN